MLAAQTAGAVKHSGNRLSARNRKGSGTTVPRRAVGDTGASTHVAPYGNNEFLLDSPVELSTSNGHIVVTKGVEVNVPELGVVRCIKVPKLSLIHI